jgi:hypothetical protein
VTQPQHNNTPNQLLRELAALIRTHGLFEVVCGLSACCRWAGHHHRSNHNPAQGELWERAASALEWAGRSCQGLGPKG